jgi:feruloyl esterase
MAYTLGLGFATVSGNNGHNGTSGLAFYNNTEVVHDFADRSIHLGVVIGKQVTAQYYGMPHTKSYYLGCSTGGRQGFKTVQTYPEDFDGVVAGAPAIAFTNLTSWSAHFYTIFGANASSPAFIPAGNLWTVIHKEILNQCDGLDGAVDGILEDPSLCQFRPEALLCGSSNSTNCLTPAQAGAVREAFADYYGIDGSLIYPGMQPGSEAVASRLLYAGGPFPYSVDWFRYVVYSTSPLLPSSPNTRLTSNRRPNVVSLFLYPPRRRCILRPKPIQHPNLERRPLCLSITWRENPPLPRTHGRYNIILKFCSLLQPRFFHYEPTL